MAEVARLLRRSPHLLVEWEGKDLILTNCDTLRRFRVDERLLALLSSLDAWVDETHLVSSGGPPIETLDHLVQLGVVEAKDGAGPDEAEPRQTWWSPVELAVHRRQNIGGSRRAGPPREGDLPPSVSKPRCPGLVTQLPPPAIPPSQALLEVIERRRSIRSYGQRPLRLDELSALLYHSCRVKEVVRDEVVGEQAFRPFPGGGARSELEIYVVVNDVEGLVAGAHYYDPRSHALVLLRGADEHQASMNRWLDDATGGELSGHPAAVLIVTAVFGRVMWKYEGIGLSLIYQDVGCLYQTLYLVATALDLAPCAIGASQELANAWWLGLDPLVESQVGSFLVGPRKAS